MGASAPSARPSSTWWTQRACSTSKRRVRYLSLHIQMLQAFFMTQSHHGHEFCRTRTGACTLRQASRGLDASQCVHLQLGWSL